MDHIICFGKGKHTYIHSNDNNNYFDFFFCHLPYLCLVITLNVVPRTKTKDTGLGNLELGCVLISMYNPHRVKLIITEHCAPTVAECSQQMVETKRSH